VQSGLAQDSLVLPDLVAAPEEQLSEWAEKGLLLPLEEYIALPELGLDEPFYPQYVQQNQHDGQVVGIPALRSANVIFYNRTWAEELGFSHPPTTPLEFKEQACKAAVANNTSKTLEKFGTGGWLIDTDALTILSWLDAFGAHPLPTSARSKYVFESRESQEAFAFLRGMLDDGCAWLRRSQTPDDYFSRRLALFYTGTAPDMLEQKRANGLAKSQDEWIVLPYPRKNGGSMIYSNGYSLAVLDPSNRSASEETQRKQMAAWLFIRWVSQPENQTALAKNFPSLPVSSAEADLLEKEKNSFPWNLLLPLNDVAQPAPALPTWRAVRRLVEDAGWQVFHLPADQVAGILPELDAGIQEMIR